MPMFSLDFGYRKSADSSMRSRSFSRSSEDDEALRGSLKRTLGQPYYKSAVEAEGKLDFGELELELWDSRYMLRGYKDEPKWTGWCRPSCIPITIIFILIVLVVVLSVVDQNHLENVTRSQLLLEKEWQSCRNTCRISLVESIPDGLTFNSSVSHPSTYSAWVQLIDSAQEEIQIGSFYWNLDDPTAPDPKLPAEGQDILRRLMDAGTRRKIAIKIAQNSPSSAFPNNDTANLERAKAAQVRSLDFHKLLGAGVLHTKMWVVDQKHVYLGSANFDWRSLTQVKELGVLALNCSCLAKDLSKIFDVYWYLGQEGKIPKEWPSTFSTIYGKDKPMNISFGGVPYQSYLSSSPPPFCATGRTSDLDAIVSVIKSAEDFIHIAVMDYSPSLLYSKPPKFWPEIDNELRAAALDRGVQVRLLVALWEHTKNSTFKFLKSLQDLNEVYPNVTIEVKLFEVPSTPAQKQIPFARVNHNKYMVTEKSAYVGTSNWSGDYFTNTAGVGLVVTPKKTASANHTTTTTPVPSSKNASSTDSSEDSEANFRYDLAQVFERDWNSSYALPLDEVMQRFFNGEGEYIFGDPRDDSGEEESSEIATTTVVEN